MDEFFKDIPNVSVTHPEDGAVAIVTVGTSNDIIKTVRICSQKRFKGSYGVCFGSCQLPTVKTRGLAQVSNETGFLVLSYCID